MTVEVKVPNIGDFSNVEIIDIAVQAGDSVAAEDPLITLESDKASIDVPSPEVGIIRAIRVGLGDRVSEGDVILTLEPAESSSQDDAGHDHDTGHNPEQPPDTNEADGKAAVSAAASRAASAGDAVDVVVLGSGPGGYSAAFRAADLGLKTVLVERYASLGGVCLNVGCIPSKALLHAAKVISEAREAQTFGIDFGTPSIDLARLGHWKDKVLGQLTQGLSGLAKQRQVKVVHGHGRFHSSHQLAVAGADGEALIDFKHAIIAAGSQPATVPTFPDDPRIMDSTGALKLEDIPERLLVIGGGIIGLEMATVYHELGSRVTVVELLDSLIAGADADIVKPLYRRIAKQYENIYLGTGVKEIVATNKELTVAFAGPKAPETAGFDRILVAVGRRPNGNNIAADKAGVKVDEGGFIAVDTQQRSNVPHIFAIGDIVGQPMLAHKAVHEGKVAAEVIAGLKSRFDARVIPSVAYTDPEVAWIGVTETEAKARGLDYDKGVFPWAASGRSLSIGRNEGLTKLLFDKGSERVIGAGIVGPQAGDLIAEVALAIEMGCDASDLGLTIHPHPTLSETVAMSAEMFEGTITDLYAPRKK